MADIFKLLIGLANADSKLDKVIVAVKEALLVVLAAEAAVAGASAVLNAVEQVLRGFLSAAGAS